MSGQTSLERCKCLSDEIILLLILKGKQDHLSYVFLELVLNPLITYQTQKRHSAVRLHCGGTDPAPAAVCEG